MRKKSEFEKQLENNLSRDLNAATPDNWNKIKLAAEQCQPDSAEKTKRRFSPRILLSKRVLIRAVPAVLGSVIFIAGLSVLFNRMPMLEAKAELPYDSGGHLTSVTTGNLDESFIHAYNSFGLSLLKHQNTNQNVFISPASIYLALGMTYNGAQGQTASEFSNVLGIKGESLDSFNNSCLSLQALINRSGRFRLANSIWVGNSYVNDISGSFLNRDKTYFGASVGTLDFSSPGASEIINRWIKTNTNNKIDPNLKQFDANTAMVLINTIYFKSDWATKFRADQTQSGTFQSPTGNKTVPYMHGGATGYFENNILQGVLLPYNDNKTSMLILLPKKNISDMLGKLTVDDLTTFAKENKKNKAFAVLTLPRVNFSYNTSLGATLKSLGIKSAFDSGKADFSGMMQSGKKSLFISEVNHLTYLAIDENGTEAAAATYIPMSGAAPNLKYLNVNRPFLAAIVDNDTGAVLFTGVVNDPSAS